MFLMAPSKERGIAKLMGSGFYRLIDLSEWAQGGHTARFSFNQRRAINNSAEICIYVRHTVSSKIDDYFRNAVIKSITL